MLEKIAAIPVLNIVFLSGYALYKLIAVTQEKVRFIITKRKTK